MLRPGGVFVASTFLKASAPLGQLLQNDDIVRPLNAVNLLNVLSELLLHGSLLIRQIKHCIT